MRAAHVVIAIALAVIVAPTAAYAQAGAVVVYGTAKPHDRQVVAAAVTRTVRQASWTVESEPSFTQKETQDIITCLALDRPWPCVDPIASAKHIERLAVVQVDPDGKSVVVIGQILLNSTAVPSLERRFCDPCSDMELDQFAQELINVLLERTAARAGDTAIEIHTIPPGASIIVDGRSGGTSDTKISVSAGQHEVRIQLPGYPSHVEQITAIEGQTVKSTVRLDVAAPGGIDGDRPSRLVAGLVGGAGAVALIGGSVYSLTRGSQHDVKQQPKYLYSGAGLAVASVGTVALGIGLYLWFHHPQNRSMPVVSYVPRGGTVGWTTSF